MKHRRLITLTLLFCLPVFAAVFSQEQSSLDSILPLGAKMEKITGDTPFDTAGSPCYFRGILYFTNNNFDDLQKSRVMKMDNPGGVQIIRPNNGMTATLKPNRAGNLFACEMMGHRIVEMDSTGKVLRVVVGEYNGKRIDGPNDLVIDRKGGFYFTDSQFIGKKQKMQDKPAIYYVTKGGAVTRVADDVLFPNGLGLSLDGKTLFVANTQGKYLLAYDVAANGSLSNRRNFAELKISKENIAKKSEMSGADGLAVARTGDVYVATTQGFGIQVFDKTGKHLGNISCPAPTNNCSFGGKDMRTLYVSAKDGMYSIRTRTVGFRSF